MNGLTIPSFLYWCPVFQVAVLILGALICFFMAYANNHASLYLPFISETGAYSGEICVFSLILIIGSFIGIIIVLYRYALIDLTTPCENILLKQLNNLSCFLGLLAMFGLAGVAAFPMTTVYWAHLLMAGIYFVCMMIYIIIVTIYTFKDNKFAKLLKFRVILSVLIIILMLFLIICFPIAHKRWHDFNSIIPALKVPENKGFTLVFISSCLEWGIMCTILLFTLTLFAELKTYREFLQLTFTSDQSKEDFVLPENPPPQSE